MPYYITTLILLVISIFLTIITLAVNGKGKVAFGVGAVAAAISAAISFTTMSIPKPEIYTTNGNSVKENEVYFSTEWPLTVKYTLVPYDDPMKNGAKFKLSNVPGLGGATYSGSLRSLHRCKHYYKLFCYKGLY